MTERLSTYPKLTRKTVAVGMGGLLMLTATGGEAYHLRHDQAAAATADQTPLDPSSPIGFESRQEASNLRVAIVRARQEQAARNALRVARAIPMPAPTKPPAPPPSPSALPSAHPTPVRTLHPAVKAPVVARAPQNLSANALLAEQMAAKRGWTGQQWVCLNELWSEESGFNTYAQNSSSGAYGIPQSLPGNKMASAGSDWQTNPATQITWGLDYITGRYGTPCGAESYHLVHNSY